MLETLYEKRPFKVRNADEYDLSSLLDLFVDPSRTLSNPFEFENTIVKGRMGAGKTMYLRANHAYHLFTLIPCLLENTEPILPVYIKLSDYQHISEPIVIYKQLILRIMKEITNCFLQLQNSKNLTALHRGFLSIPEKYIAAQENVKLILHELMKLSSIEYIEHIEEQTGIGVESTPRIFKGFIDFKKKYELEMKKIEDPGIHNIEWVYECLLSEYNGKVLLLLDEAGSISQNFFRTSTSGNSYFEILMNQLRTTQFIRTKIAVYPQSYSDILTETRYGDVVFLQEDIYSYEGYNSFYERVLDLISRYCTRKLEADISAKDVFDLQNEKENPIEQLINASYGNMRRMINLLDITFSETYKDKRNRNKKVTHQNVISALSQHSCSNESLFSQSDKTFLESIGSVCRRRSTYRFKFPNNAPILYKYISKSSEFNLLNIIEAGSGRRSSIYSFDYSYCVRHSIPTHYFQETERIDKSRSRITGVWVTRNATISEELLKNAEIPGKKEGKIEWLRDEAGYIKADDGIQYFFSKSYIIEQDKNSHLYVGRRVLFNPSKIEDTLLALYIEVP